MADVILFKPKAELDAEASLANFVALCRDQLTVFGADLRFDDDAWDVTESLGLRGHGNKRHRLVFSTLESVNDGTPTPMMEPFLSFAKSYMRYMHGLRPAKDTGKRITALRSLHDALTEKVVSPNPVKMDAHTFNRAAQMISLKYTPAVAYRAGGQLELVARFLTENRLTVVPVKWKNFIKRPVDTVRVGKEFDERRQSKLPSPAALDALPKVFNLAQEPQDVIAASVAAILCSCPDRISEVLTLPADCEVYQRQKSGDEAYGLRWWPAKGAEPMVKWVVPSLAGVVQEAIKRIRNITKEARLVAQWYESNPGKLYLPGGLESLRDQEHLGMQELADVIGLIDVGSANAWVRNFNIPCARRNNKIYVRFADVERTVISMLPSQFPVLDQGTGLSFSNALFVARKNELGAQRATYRCLIEPINTNQINTGLGGRAAHGFESVFSRLGFTEPDGSPLKITTHQFRHYLNTLAQAGGMSQLDIAKWSGRKDIRQNAAYDHVTSDQMLERIRASIGDGSQMFGPLAEMPKKVLIPRDEFSRLLVPTAHTTDFGFCIHDYTMTPCQMHLDCIHCEDLVCVKGDEEKTKRLRMRLDDAKRLMEQAQNAVEDGYAGSDRWMEHHTSEVERLDQLYSIMTDPNVPAGAIIQLAPPKVNKQLNSPRSRLADNSNKNLRAEEAAKSVNWEGENEK